jgi:RimJ/RimL family protein N-acetyltransferase
MPDLAYLRPITEADLDLQELLYSDPQEASEFGFFGYVRPGGMRRLFAEQGFMSDNEGRLAVAVGPGGDFIGEVSWRRSHSGPTSSCWHIGAGLLVRARGQGHGSRAQRLLAEYLFAHTILNRVAAETEAANRAEQRSLEKAGFTREGTLRGACFRAGQWRDMVSYGVVRADLAGAEPGPAAGG